MPWNPQVYDQFKNERQAPFEDAAAMIDVRPGMRVADLGCGTGELTARLSVLLPESDILGIDNSAEMLEKAATLANTGLRFELMTVQDWLATDQKYDLLFSNAALQWLPDHRSLFPELLDQLNPGGQLVVQMPAQHRNQANLILYALAEESPYREALQGYQRALSMLNPEDYAELLFRGGAQDIRVFEKIYPLVVPDAQGVYDFINGSALRPYLAALDVELRSAFSQTFLMRLEAAFPQQPVFYAFKRILFSARV
jgi:trans-aconitate 2-methyltransferase